MQAGFAHRLPAADRGAPATRTCGETQLRKMLTGDAAPRGSPAHPYVCGGWGVPKLGQPSAPGAGHRQNGRAVGEAAVSSEASALGAVPRRRPQHPLRRVFRSRRWLWALSRHPPASLRAGRARAARPAHDLVLVWGRSCLSSTRRRLSSPGGGHGPAAIPGEATGRLASVVMLPGPRRAGHPHGGPRGGTQGPLRCPHQNLAPGGTGRNPAPAGTWDVLSLCHSELCPSRPGLSGDGGAKGSTCR